MEVKPGYKHTEVGVVPTDWAIETLGNLGRWFSGGTPSMANGSYWGGDIPWMSAKDMKVSRIHDSQLHVTEEAIGNGTRLAPPGSVLMVVRGMILAHTFPVAVAKRPVAFNQDMKALTAFDSVDGEFVMLWLQANAQKILGIASESTHGTKRIPSEDLFAVKLGLPHKPEQCAIAEALSDVDGLLDGLERLIAKKREMKKAAMQQLLTGQVRLAGFSSDWTSARIGDHFTFKNGLNKGKQYFGYGTPIVNYMDVYKAPALNASCLTGRVFLTADEIKNFSVKKGDVFFTRTSETTEDIGVAAVMLDEPVDTVFSGFVLRARPITQAFADEFKAYCFGAHDVRRQITSRATYTTRALTNGKILSNVTVPLPGKEEQAAIAAALTDMDSEIAALAAKRQKAALLKQGMMQQLLTGKVRLV